MKILIVDDKKENHLSGQILEQRGHEVTHAYNFIDAVTAMEISKYSMCEKDKSVFDIVLTDLFYSWGPDRDCPFSRFESSKDEHPLGYGLALAAIQCKTPYVGMVTNQNHHSGAVAATWDFLHESPIQMNESIAGFWDERGVHQYFKREKGVLVATDEYVRDGIKTKPWPKVVDILTKTKPHTYSSQEREALQLLLKGKNAIETEFSSRKIELEQKLQEELESKQVNFEAQLIQRESQLTKQYQDRENELKRMYVPNTLSDRIKIMWRGSLE